MTTITIKRSSTASAIPLAGDLAVGELAVNLEDKRLFTKQSDGTVIELSTNPTDLDAATLRIDGVEITASATELNSLDGLTATTAELNILDGVTATATELNKLDGYIGSTAELNTLDGITASTTELNYTDGVTSNIQTQLDAKASSTASPTITLSGDLSGSATLTNLGSATLTATVADDSHNHVISNVDGLQTALDAKANLSGANFTGNVDVTGTVTADGLTVEKDVAGLFRNGFLNTNTGGNRQTDMQISNNSDNLFFGLHYLSGDNAFLDFRGTSSLLFLDDGSERMRIDSAGNVGIGTSSPEAKLHVEDGDVLIERTLSTGGQLTFKNNASNQYSVNKNYHQFNFITANGASETTGGYARIKAGQENSGSNNSTYIGLWTAPSGGTVAERMRIDSSGNVGIGTASPYDSKLEVSGKTKASEFRASSGSGAKGYDFTASGSGAGLANMFCPSGFTLAFGTNNSERARIDSSGNLLVGTTSLDGSTGCYIGNSGVIEAARSGVVQYLNRTGSNGQIAQFRKDGSAVGSIATQYGNLVVSSGDSGLLFYEESPTSTQVLPCKADGTVPTNDINLGNSGRRFKDLYLSGGVFLGGTGAANKLDDYEEGTWTPKYIFYDNSAGGFANFASVTYDIQQGYYTKVGNLVTVVFSLRTTSLDKGVALSDEPIYVDGLPFDPTGLGGAGICDAQQGFVNNAPSFLSASTTGVIPLRYLNDDVGGYTSSTVGNLSTGTSVNRLLNCTITYRTLA